MSDVQYVYRGVHGNHPALLPAKQGIVMPGDPHGDMTPEEHNMLDIAQASQFTSWTYHLPLARSFARSWRKGGVVLRLPITAPAPGDEWEWVPSPDYKNEMEVLLLGARMDAEVFEVMS